MGRWKLLLWIVGLTCNAYAVFQEARIVREGATMVIGVSDFHVDSVHSPRQKEQLLAGVSRFGARLIVEDGATYEHLRAYLPRFEKKLGKLQEIVKKAVPNPELSTLRFLHMHAIRWGIACDNIEFCHLISVESRVSSFAEALRMVSSILVSLRASCKRVLPNRYERVEEMVRMLRAFVKLLPASCRTLVRKASIDCFFTAVANANVSCTLQCTMTSMKRKSIAVAREQGLFGLAWKYKKQALCHAPRDLYELLLGSILDLRIVDRILSSKEQVIVVGAGGVHIDNVMRMLQAIGFSQVECAPGLCCPAERNADAAIDIADLFKTLN